MFFFFLGGPLQVWFNCKRILFHRKTWNWLSGYLILLHSLVSMTSWVFTTLLLRLAHQVEDFILKFYRDHIHKKIYIFQILFIKIICITHFFTWSICIRKLQVNPQNLQHQFFIIKNIMENIKKFTANCTTRVYDKMILILTSKWDQFYRFSLFEIPLNNVRPQKKSINKWKWVDSII